MCLSAYIFGHNIFKTRISNGANELNLGFDLFVCESTEIHRKSTQVDDRRDDSASRVFQVLAFACVFCIGCICPQLRCIAHFAHLFHYVTLSLFFCFLSSKTSCGCFLRFLPLEIAEILFLGRFLGLLHMAEFSRPPFAFFPSLVFFFSIFFFALLLSICDSVAAM